VESYDDFLWEKYEPQPLKFVITSQFKECDHHEGTIVLDLCEGDMNKTSVVSTDIAQVYVNGEIAEGNRIRIPVGATETEVEIRFNKEQLSEDATYHWHIKLRDDAGLTKVFAEDGNGAVMPASQSQPWVKGMDICVQNDHVANSLKVWSITGLWTILGIIGAIFVICRLSHLPVKFNEVMVDYGYGYERRRTGRCYKVVFTDKPYKVSLLSRIFNGKVAVIRNEFWTDPVVLKGQFGNRNGLFFMTAGDYILPDVPVRQEPFEIKKTKTLKVKMYTN
jgi:hypothetical protein